MTTDDFLSAPCRLFSRTLHDLCPADGSCLCTCHEQEEQ